MSYVYGVGDATTGSRPTPPGKGASVGLLNGKVALVTGAAGVIGADSARALAEEGARVVLTDVNSEGLEAATAALATAGHEVRGHVCDLTDEASIKELVAAAASAFGGVDILDNNAGATHLSGQDSDLLSISPELWAQSTAINLTGPMLMCRNVIPLMIERGGGAIVNISSGQSLGGDDRNTAYAAGKGGLNSLTRHLAVQYGPKGVRVNAIAPGLIVSEENQAKFPGAYRDMFVGNLSVQRLGKPEDISNAVVFLASDRSSYINGQILSIDGGFSTQLGYVGSSRQLNLAAINTKG